MGVEENAKWTERGVLMDVTIKKKMEKQLSEQLKVNPLWVNRTPKGTFFTRRISPYHHYQTYILKISS